MAAILGISAFYHDSAACLVVDGEIIAAAQEERFTRIKHDESFPASAIQYCLSEAGINPSKLDYIGFYDKPLLKFERLLQTYVDYAPKGFFSFVKSMPVWMKQKLWLPDLIRLEMAKLDGYGSGRSARKQAKSFEGKLLFGDHHESHAASAFYPSPFHNAAILTMDGVGEWATSSIGFGDGNEVTLLRELRFPNSLGLLYSAFTYYTGFKVNSGEYKVMGLAPYGEPKYVRIIKENLVEIRDDGSLRMNPDYFGYAHTLRMTNRAFERLLGGKPRRPETELTQRELDLARSIQDVTEEVMLKMARFAATQTGSRRLCMAGGVALNCVGNGKILRSGLFDDIWIQPAAGDAGGAVGVALAIWHRYLKGGRVSPEENGTWRSSRLQGESAAPYMDGMKGAYLGPQHTEADIQTFLSTRGIPYRQVEPEALPFEIAGLLANEKVIGLHHGRMEFGPRSLGNRSIIADARSPRMQSVMNLKIKFRESFRPFAPSVQREYVNEWFEINDDSPYMLLVADVASRHRRMMTPDEEALWGIAKLNVVRSSIPAVTHVDYSARVQTVRREINPFYWSIIDAFRRKTGCPVIVNTSFNVRGEPMVCSPEDSYRCFMRTNIDVLVLENFVLMKTEQPSVPQSEGWENEFVLD
jgi:carbamoyltransferase